MKARKCKCGITWKLCLCVDSTLSCVHVAGKFWAKGTGSTTAHLSSPPHGWILQCAMSEHWNAFILHWGLTSNSVLRGQKHPPPNPPVEAKKQRKDHPFSMKSKLNERRIQPDLQLVTLEAGRCSVFLSIQFTTLPSCNPVFFFSKVKKCCHLARCASSLF